MPLLHANLPARLVTLLALVTAVNAAALADNGTDSLEPVPCMSIANEGMQALYANMKDVVLSTQVCVSESRFATAAELYFITWPFMSFNQEVTRNDQINNAYVNALDASLRHYFANMSETEQESLLTEFDAIVSDPEQRTRMCALLTASAPPFVDIRQQSLSGITDSDATSLWARTVRDYGCI